MSRDGAGTVLVVGATGFIGCHCADQLEAAGRTVIRASRGGREADIECDLMRPESVRGALEQSRPDAVVLAAGISSVGAAWEEPEAAFEMNTWGTFNLLEAVRDAAPECHLLFASSGAVYGATAGAPTEREPVRPASPYAASKAAADLLCSQYAREHGVAITVVRMFNQVGPGQPSSQAPSEFAREIARAEGRGDAKLELEVGNPSAERDYTDVRDTARAWEDLIERRATGLFNLCSGRTAGLEAIIDGLAGNSPVEVEMKVRPGRAHPADPPKVAGSNRKLSAATGWRPEIPLAESLADLLADWRRRI